MSFATGQRTADISLDISDDEEEEGLEVSTRSFDGDFCIFCQNIIIFIIYIEQFLKHRMSVRLK